MRLCTNFRGARAVVGAFADLVRDFSFARRMSIALVSSSGVPLVSQRRIVETP